ncbi:MAG: uroporphyrinogen-III C-methyltransferase [Gammaproteobacteria bacterium]|nr:uroporphyrinogen-III C-methyltransferase [Gammaproteobacteria bacterium]MCP4089082.1 uroporphyrinogen-III C-methyltransferase [Gammaproteobacteria bacterium]MCP4276893.1 uroporphyrinogen-III C-methyltransferase [Gammaproteobacteria bacterium]MCP4830736.1 uroporphyrinogen-III C-methyltransferase [Gammaproteobacteria bacterium]MCP4928840.1 uroporphyrinogen-III C-methyltransferase [Gammaproteobacteria bacterium]
MDFLPIFLNIQNRPCLVVGGGPVALRKAELLLSAGAAVKVVAPEIRAEFADLKPAPECLQEEFQPHHLDGTAIVIVATSSQKINTNISKLAMERDIPVNVVDNPALCSFIVPAVVDRDPIIVAVGSSGAAPVLARLTRAKIEAILPQTLGRLGELAKNYRQAVKDRFTSITVRRRFWELIFEGEVADKVYRGDFEAGEQQLQELLVDDAEEISSAGEVALVGGGPGDPELMTFKAVRLLQRADVVIYDRLLSPEIVNLARRDAERIYAGKASSKHSMPQEDINALLVKLAQEGKRVVRLKGGDPFVFGRGGEEISELMNHGISFQVVPGITSALGCSSYCGIPLTHRDYAQSVVFATGHLRNDTVDLNWEMLTQPNQTAVIYMGLLGLAIISEKMIAHGLSAEMPVAVVRNATMPNQKIVIGTLANIFDKSTAAGMTSPCLIIVGEVVNLHEQLKWYREADTTATA